MYEINHGLDHYLEADQDVFNEDDNKHLEHLRKRMETHEISHGRACDLDIKQA